MQEVKVRQLRISDSSNVVSVTYDTDQKAPYIDVEFTSGATYRYRDVTLTDFADCACAPSVGKWVNARLVSKKVFDKLPDAPKAEHPSASDRLRTALQLIASLTPQTEVRGILEPTLREAIGIAREALAPEQSIEWPRLLLRPVVEEDDVSKVVTWGDHVLNRTEAEALGLALIARAREARR